MKYFLFLFCISMGFSESAFSEWASNKACAPGMQKCMRDYSAKYGRSFESPSAKAALAQCNVQYEECATANGVIKQDNGSYAQLYHPANPDFIACKKKIDDSNSDAFRACMKSRGPGIVKQTPKPEPTYQGGELREIQVVGRAPCSKRYPGACKTEETCLRNNGEWNGTKCIAARCPEGTTINSDQPEMCQCNGEVAGVQIEAGTAQQCPKSCVASEHKVYDPLARGCACVEGYADRSGLGRCVSTADPTPKVDECIRELQAKVTSCNSAASTAVDKCDPKREGGSGEDSLTAIQNLLGAGAGAVQAKNAGTGAMDNCMNAAIASSSGYYAIEELRGKCDGEINTCKTSCSDAGSFISANKDRVYQECRKKLWTEVECVVPGATPWDISRGEPGFNEQYDRVNKAAFESQVQQMQKSIADNNTKCETGTAVTNRDKMTDFMNDMNTSVKSANQCQCQLGSSGQDCSKQVGPAECTVNPNLPGCAQSTANCLSASDTSQKCVCFRNPNSNECKSIQEANNGKVNSTEVSSFAGGGSAPTGGGIGGSGTSGKTATGDVAGDLSGLGPNGETLAGGVSGSATADGGSPFGAATGSNPGGGAGPGGGSADGATGATDGEDDGTGKKSLGGLFDVAKSALGNLFKKGTGDKNGFDGVNKNSLNGSNNSALDSKKWRPRGLVRGLAGDTEIAGKHEDIWKVMNKQYKVQDQKDSFIFGGEKK